MTAPSRLKSLSESGCIVTPSTVADASTVEGDYLTFSTSETVWIRVRRPLRVVTAAYIGILYGIELLSRVGASLGFVTP